MLNEMMHTLYLIGKNETICTNSLRGSVLRAKHGAARAEYR